MSDEMSRRRFALAALGAAGLAGCNGFSDGGTPAGERGSPRTATVTPAPVETATATRSETETSTPTRTETATETPTETPTATTTESPYAVPDDAAVTLVPLPNEREVVSPIHVSMLAEAFTIEEAGEVTDDAGHFHVIVDEDPVETGRVIPEDDQHLHFDGGQNQAILDLDPGYHELTLQLANGNDEALPLTDTLAVTVTGQSGVSITAPEHMAPVNELFTVEMEAQNFSIREVDRLRPNSGHFHVLVDRGPVPTGERIPSGGRHVDLTDGSDSALLDLDPGEHTVTVQLGDALHRALPVSDSITVIVQSR